MLFGEKLIYNRKIKNPKKQKGAYNTQTYLNTLSDKRIVKAHNKLYRSLYILNLFALNIFCPCLSHVYESLSSTSVTCIVKKIHAYIDY